MEMKSYSKAIAAILAIATLAVATVSCSRFGKSKGQSTEFAAFIKAYTGGIISDKSTIRVELATDIPDAVPGADIKDGILSFTPSIKGTTRWLSRSTIEFIPEPGALKNGQSYTAKLRLGKIEKIADRAPHVTPTMRPVSAAARCSLACAWMEFCICWFSVLRRSREASRWLCATSTSSAISW